MSVGGEQDVGRLDVPVQHPGAVRGLDGAADLHRDAQHLRHRHPFAPVALAEHGRAELHHEVGAAVGGDAGLVDGEDGGVGAELGHEIRLGLEHLAHLVVDHLAQHHLDGDLPPWHILLIQEDVGETAGTENVHVGETGQHGRLGRQTSSHLAPSPETGLPL